MAQRTTLLSVGRLARQALSTAEELGNSSAFSQLQKRFSSSERYSPRLFGKAKPVDPSALWQAKSPYVEALYWRRDHLEREFTWNKRTTFELTYFLGGITALFYALSLFGVRSADRQSGYPTRNFVFHPTNSTFINPDEREFY